MIWRVLLVEDTEERQAILTQLYRSHAFILVTTGARAISMLRAYTFDIISLDFNLRGDLKGTDVARALLETPNARARVVIHSLNPKGASALAELLPEAIVYQVSKMARTHAHLKHLREQIDELGPSYDWSDR